jgi:hypothetical protein
MAFRRENVGDRHAFDNVLAKLNEHRRQPSVEIAHMVARRAPMYSIDARVPEAAISQNHIFELYMDVDSLSSKTPVSLPFSEEALEQELGLEREMSVAALTQSRRRFSWFNHPDRAGDGSPNLSLERMQMANAIFDKALMLARERRFAKMQTQFA